MNQQVDPEHRQSALPRLERAAHEMPVLGGIADRYRSDLPLRNERIALCGHITEATAIQVRTLRALGAEIAWCASSTSTTDDAVRETMMDEVALVSGSRGMSPKAMQKGVEQVLSHFSAGPSLILDEGARLLRALHQNGDGAESVKLAAEKTPEGIHALQSMILKVPVLMSDLSIGKRLVDNPHGTAQSLLDTIAAVTRGLFAGKTLLVCGYGRVGTGIAAKARGLGLRVLVAETRPTRALIATLNGFEVLPLVEALQQAQIVLTVTGSGPVVGGEHFALLRHDVLLVNGGHLPNEIDVAALRATAEEYPIAPGLRGYRLGSGKCIQVMADGNIANLSVGSGNPNEVMDMTFASQVMALVLGRNAGLGPGLHALPDASEAAIARMIAESLGIDTAELV